jgi:hypothetical protein
MPDERWRREYQLPPLIEEPPAEVDIVSSSEELRLKPPYFFQGFSAHDEVTAWEMLRPEVLREDMGGGACSRGDNSLLQALRRGREIRASGGSGLGVIKATGYPEEPIDIGLAVIVCVGDELSSGRIGSVITGIRKPSVFLSEVADFRETGSKLGGLVGGPVVNNKNLEIWIIQRAAGTQAGFQMGRSIMCADDHRDPWGVILERRGNTGGRDFWKNFAERLQNGFLAFVAPGQPEGPVFHPGAPACPAIGPREKSGAGYPRGEALLEMSR